MTGTPHHEPSTAARRTAVRWQHAGVAMLALGVYVALCLELRAFTTDDAYISFRYARNVAEGFGPVWNPGEAPVEAYSNPLLVGMLVLGIWSGIAPVAFAKVIGIVAGASTIVVTAAIGGRLVGGRAALAGTCILAVSPAFAYWSVGGLETTLAMLFLTLSTLLLSLGRAHLVAGLALAALVWIRPEAPMVGVGLAAGVALLRRRHGLAWSSLVRPLAAFAGPALLSLVALEVSRLVVFGHLVPNPILYKTAGGFGGITAKFLLQLAPMVPLLVLGARATTAGRLVLFVPVSIYVAGSLVMKDSVNTFSRFMLPIWPCLCLVAGVGISELERRTLGRFGPPVAALLSVAVIVSQGLLPPAGLFQAARATRTYVACRAAPREDVADYLRMHAADAEHVSIADVGVLGYRATQTVLDHFFLTSSELPTLGRLSAAERARRILDRAPDVVVLASRREDRFDATYETDARIAADPRFARYDLVRVAGGVDRCDYVLFVYRLRDRAHAGP